MILTLFSLRFNNNQQTKVSHWWLHNADIYPCGATLPHSSHRYNKPYDEQNTDSRKNRNKRQGSHSPNNTELWHWRSNNRWHRLLPVHTSKGQPHHTAADGKHRQWRRSPQSTSPILSTRTQTRGLAPRTDSGSDGNRNAATPLGQRFVYSHKRLLRRQLLMLKGSDRRSLYHGNAQYGHSLVIISWSHTGLQSNR